MAEQEDDRVEPRNARGRRRDAHIEIQSAFTAPSARELKERFHGVRVARNGGVAEQIAKVGSSGGFNSEIPSIQTSVIWHRDAYHRLSVTYR